MCATIILADSVVRGLSALKFMGEIKSCDFLLKLLFVFFRQLHLESLLLHPQLLPRERHSLPPHARLLLRRVLRHPPRPAAALWPVPGPVGGHTTGTRCRAGILLRPGCAARSRGGSPEDRDACGEPAFPVERHLEALAAAMPLLLQPALLLQASRGHKFLTAPSILMLQLLHLLSCIDRTKRRDMHLCVCVLIVFSEIILIPFSSTKYLSFSALVTWRELKLLGECNTAGFGINPKPRKCKSTFATTGCILSD